MKRVGLYQETVAVLDHEQAALHTIHTVVSMKLERGKLLCEGTAHERWDEGESTYNQYGADEQKDELLPIGWKRCRPRPGLFFRNERPGDSKSRNNDKESSA